MEIKFYGEIDLTFNSIGGTCLSGNASTSSNLMQIDPLQFMFNCWKYHQLEDCNGTTSFTIHIIYITNICSPLNVVY